MLTCGEQKVIGWLRKATVATMKQIRHQFRISHMTVVRALKKAGYYASYNYNAAYYVLGTCLSSMIGDCGAPGHSLFSLPHSAGDHHGGGGESSSRTNRRGT